MKIDTYEVWIGLGKSQRLHLFDELNPYNETSFTHELNAKFFEFMQRYESIIEAFLCSNHGSLEFRATLRSMTSHESLPPDFHGISIRYVEHEG